MSAIGSFFILPDLHRELLADAAQTSCAAPTPTKKRWGRTAAPQPPRPDPIEDFLGRNAIELAELRYSGNVLLEVELVTPGALSSEDDLGDLLSRSTGLTFVSFRPADAYRSIEVLDSADSSDEAIHGALVALRGWLQAVAEGTTGILRIS